MLFAILKALAGKPEEKKPKKKTQAQIEKERQEREYKLWELAEEYEEEE